VTQYERDFERVSATVRKEVVRFEVPISIPVRSTSVTERLKMPKNYKPPFFVRLFKCLSTERKDQEFQKADNQVLGVSASVSAAGEHLSNRKGPQFHRQTRSN